MTDTEVYNLATKLDLLWLHGNTYNAKVSVTTTDSCFHEGELAIAVPAGQPMLPDTEYLTFSFTHTGTICGKIVRTVEKSIEVSSSVLKTNVEAFAVVNGKVAGHDKKQFPRMKADVA